MNGKSGAPLFKGSLKSRFEYLNQGFTARRSTTTGLSCHLTTGYSPYKLSNETSTKTTTKTPIIPTPPHQAIIHRLAGEGIRAWCRPRNLASEPSLPPAHEDPTTRTRTPPLTLLAGGGLHPCTLVLSKRSKCIKNGALGEPPERWEFQRGAARLLMAPSLLSLSLFESFLKFIYPNPNRNRRPK